MGYVFVNYPNDVTMSNNFTNIYCCCTGPSFDVTEEMVEVWVTHYLHMFIQENTNLFNKYLQPGISNFKHFKTLTPEKRRKFMFKVLIPSAYETEFQLLFCYS